MSDCVQCRDCTSSTVSTHCTASHPPHTRTHRVTSVVVTVSVTILSQHCLTHCGPGPGPQHSRLHIILDHHHLVTHAQFVCISPPFHLADISYNQISTSLHCFNNYGLLHRNFLLRLTSGILEIITSSSN